MSSSPKGPRLAIVQTGLWFWPGLPVGLDRVQHIGGWLELDPAQFRSKRTYLQNNEPLANLVP